MASHHSSLTLCPEAIRLSNIVAILFVGNRQSLLSLVMATKSPGSTPAPQRQTCRQTMVRVSTERCYYLSKPPSAEMVLPTRIRLKWCPSPTLLWSSPNHEPADATQNARQLDSAFRHYAEHTLRRPGSMPPIVMRAGGICM
jgi:hypothetical protein